MKELWRCLLPALGCDEKNAKRLRKAVQPAEYLALAQQIFDWYEQKHKRAVGKMRSNILLRAVGKMRSNILLRKERYLDSPNDKRG